MQLNTPLRQEQQAVLSDSRMQGLASHERDNLVHVCLLSPWFRDWLYRQPDWPLAWAAIVREHPQLDELRTRAQQWSLTDEARVLQDLRQWRNGQLARLIARDALYLQDVQETAKQLSQMARLALEVALAWSTRLCQQQLGVPSTCPYSRQPQQLIVLALGKLGANELNLSSDIDLIFAFPAAGSTDQGIANELFFTRLGRKLIQLLEARTEDGFVFRVDMRLRPWGEAGALVSNFQALQNYYQQHGRFWERYALIKAQPVTGCNEAKQALAAIIKPFVYRRYLDFQAMPALRELKQKIQHAMLRRSRPQDIKLGPGGIREIEFIVQAFQLIYGGREPQLQAPATWPMLAVLAQLQLLPKDTANALTAAYSFLRNLEHRIQSLNDEQTQALPQSELAQLRLAMSMKLGTPLQLESELDKHLTYVHAQFQLLVAEPPLAAAATVAVPSLQSATAKAHNQALAERMEAFAATKAVARLSTTARDNLNRFLAVLWPQLAPCTDGAQRFAQLQPLLEAILRRSSYFVLLAENSAAVLELVKLTAISPWILNQLTSQPALLGELAEPAKLYQCPERLDLFAELQQLLLRVPADDLEQQMELLRRFCHGHRLRAAACEATEQLPLMKISDYLVWVAEAVVQQTLALVWRDLVARHGRPSRADGDWCDSDFAVIAYGKLGGIEMSYQSDLDLVFLHNAAAQGSTQGPKVIENTVFMMRIGQKLIHLLTAITPSGALYEVDMRLRPSSNSGLLVSSLAAFNRYQQKQAWTWEHQALLRARFIAGDASLEQAFVACRQSVLSQQRDAKELVVAIAAMRAKMINHQSVASDSRSGSRSFHLKRDRGGIVDLEFIVQFLLLRHAHQHPKLVTWTDMVRAIKGLYKAGLITQVQQQQWLESYLALRGEVHQCALQGEGNNLPEASLSVAVQRARKVISAAWQHYFGSLG